MENQFHVLNIRMKKLEPGVSSILNCVNCMKNMLAKNLMITWNYWNNIVVIERIIFHNWKIFLNFLNVRNDFNFEKFLKYFCVFLLCMCRTNWISTSMCSWISFGTRFSCRSSISCILLYTIYSTFK